MFCPGCGTNNEDHVRFCYRCGRQLNDGTATTAQSGPAWKDFVEPQPEPLPEPQPPAPPPPPDPVPPQVVLGKPKRELPIAMLLGVVLAIAALSGIGYGVYYASQDLDTSSWPLIGAGDRRSADSSDAPILISLTSACKDSREQDCNLIWDLTAVKSEASGLRIEYRVRATGQAGCSVVIQPDQAMTSFFENQGRPGPFVEGARGRYYPMQGSEGITSAGGNLGCDQSEKGAWVFTPTTGESFVKVRYPGVPPARVEFEPETVRPLPPTDPFSVIPVQQTACQTMQRQACRGIWEIGPYGLAADGTPVVFFAVRFDGPAGCQVNWQSDLNGSNALIASGQRGIGLELANNSGYLLLTAGGGISALNGPQNCGTVHTGYWRFAAGSVTTNVNLNYPDFPVVQIPIKP